MIETKNMSAKGRSSFGRKCKALFLDLDGTTVLHAANEITPRVKEAITKAQTKVKVCIATGRLFIQIRQIVDQLNITGLCVVANGIQIYDPQRHTVIKEIVMHQHDVKAAYEYLKTIPNLEIHSFDGTDESLHDPMDSKKRVLSLYMPEVPATHIDSIMSYIEKHFSHLTAHKVSVGRQGIWGLEVCHATATKQHGISTVATLLGIAPHEIIGVGDGYNDFPLLMACGMKIAMGNAVPELKAIADFIAPSVEEDGVATVIEKFILK